MDTAAIAIKYGITAATDEDGGELEYAVAWEADNTIGYQPINHNRPRTSDAVMRMVYTLNDERDLSEAV